MMAELLYQEHKYPIYRGPHFMCCYCKTMFISEEFLDKHQKKCIHMKFHIMLKIKLQLRKNKLNEDTCHQTQTKTSEYYSCKECFGVFLKLSDYEKHVKDNHKEEPSSQYDQCVQKYTDEKQLQGHLDRAHQKQKSVICNPRLKSFKKKLQISLPNPSNTGDRSSILSKCPKNSTSKNILIQQPSTPSSKQAFGCDHCDKRFSQMKILKQHMLIHPKEKRFVCDHCEKRFTLKTHLTRHFLIHSGEKPFVCDQCEKRFTRQSNLTEHLLVHSGDKPFGCDLCEKRFSRRVYLMRHLRIHSGEKRFVCGHCEKRFTRNCDLSRHLLVHSGKKHFGCDHCGKRFTRKSNLLEHLLVHSEEKG